LKHHPKLLTHPKSALQKTLVDAFWRVPDALRPQENNSRSTRTLGKSEKEQISVGNLGKGEPSAPDVRL